MLWIEPDEALNQVFMQARKLKEKCPELIDDINDLFKSGFIKDLPQMDPNVNYYEKYCKLSLANLVIEQ